MSPSDLSAAVAAARSPEFIAKWIIKNYARGQADDLEAHIASAIRTERATLAALQKRCETAEALNVLLGGHERVPELAGLQLAYAKVRCIYESDTPLTDEWTEFTCWLRAEIDRLAALQAQETHPMPPGPTPEPPPRERSAHQKSNDKYAERLRAEGERAGFAKGVEAAAKLVDKHADEYGGSSGKLALQVEARLIRALTPPVPVVQPTYESAWLIERETSPIVAPLYLCFHENGGRGITNDDPPDGWLWDIGDLKAARFARQEDAEKFWTCVMGRSLDDVRIRSHGWQGRLRLTSSPAPDALPDLLPGLRHARRAMFASDSCNMVKDGCIAALNWIDTEIARLMERGT